MKTFLTTLLLLVVLLINQACSKQGPAPANPNAANSATTTPSPASSPVDSFERDLQFVRGGQYSYVWVFARKDGKVLDKDDADYLRKHAPQVVDWVTTDGGKRAIGGTNFDLEKGDMDLLRKRFVVEDYTGK